MRLLVPLAVFFGLILRATEGSAGELVFDRHLSGAETTASCESVVTAYVIRRAADGVQCELLAPEEAEAMQMRTSKLATPLRPIRNSPPRTNATGLEIVLLGTAQLDAFPEARAAFIRAAETWEAIVLSPITVTLEVDYGPTSFGRAFPADQLGSTSFVEYGVLYNTFRASLVRRPSNGRESDLFPLLSSSGIQTDIGFADAVFGAGGNLRSIGIGPAEGTTFVSPRIGFNSAVSFDTNRSDGIDADKIDFESVALHEIGHALGFTSFVGRRELDPAFPIRGNILDFFRFRPGTSIGTIATAERVLSSGGEHRFFAGLPEVALSTARTDGTGGDLRSAGHWKAASITGSRLGVMDPQLPAGVISNITANDLLAFDSMGYVIATSGSPDSPSGLSVEAVSETEVDLSWTDNADNESGFHLLVGKEERPLVRVGSREANVTTGGISGLLPGVKFRFTISAFNATGESAVAEIATITMPGIRATIPTAPTNLTATVAIPGEVELRWQDNSSDESGFGVYLAEGSEGFVLLGDTGPDATGLTVNGLEPGASLRFQVTAFNDAGESEPSNTAQVGATPASRRRPARK